ncbi:hypothetical protein N7470_008047 [Penicillium chermesinum]|nr:hypothetical protein N7470_008047 [Penicillium chermesinum]
MPIPTRSALPRDPRQPVSNPCDPQDVVNSRQSSSSARSTTGKPPTRQTATSAPYPRPRVPKIVVSPAGGLFSLNQVNPLAKMYRHWDRPGCLRLGADSHGGLSLPKRQQQTGPEPEKRGPSSKSSSAVPAQGAAPTRRQSLMRPTSLKTYSTKTNASTSKALPPAPETAAITIRCACAFHVEAFFPKKTDMPPHLVLCDPPRYDSQLVRHRAPPAAVRGHARHRSQLTPTAKQATDVTPVSSKSRPGFSTYQQHFSPRKAGKPPTPTPGEPTGTGDLLIPCSWPDITALQIELLQLSLFHSNQLQRQSEWKAESDSRLQKQYDAVANQYRTMLKNEKLRQRQLNAQALQCWAQNCRDRNGPHGISEQIQILSQVLQETSDLVNRELGGRYARAVGVFEDWIEGVGQIWQEREESGVMAGLVFIDPLDGSWKEELQGLRARLELSVRQLQSLDILGFGELERLEQSALARVAIGLGDPPTHATRSPCDANPGGRGGA